MAQLLNLNGLLSLERIAQRLPLALFIIQAYEKSPWSAFGSSLCDRGLLFACTIPAEHRLPEHDVCLLSQTARQLLI